MESNKKLGKFDIDIEIKDLLWEFLRRWRIILILALICGVGLTAYQYRIDSSKKDVVTVKKSQSELEATMGEQDLDEVTAAVALKRQMDEKSAYMENSVLMQLNPYEEYAVILQYYVSADNRENAADAADIYRAYVNNHSLAQAMIDNGTYELEPMYMAELISIKKEESNLYLNAENVAKSINLKAEESTEEHSFSIKVIGTTGEEAEALALAVKDALLNYSHTVAAIIGTHQLELLGESSSVIADQSLAELQNWNATAIKTIGNNLDKMKNEMTSDQISLYVYRTTVLADETAGGSNTTVAKSGAHISIKHFIIGIIVGIILACGLIFACYLFAPSLRSSEEIKTLYGVKVLGCINDSRFQKKKLFGFVDQFIVKLQNRRKKSLSYEQEIQLISANILLDCQKNGAQEVFLTSSAGESIPKEVLNAVSAKCEEKGIHTVAGDAIAYDAMALERLAEIGNVVFIEKKRVSLFDELYSEIALCKEHDIHVIGMIVL